MAAATRAEKHGLSREAQEKVDAKYDAALAAKGIFWIGKMAGQATGNAAVDEAVAKVQQFGEQAECPKQTFFELLFSGLAFGALINALKAGGTDLKAKTWQAATNQAFEMNRARERIGVFINFCKTEMHVVDAELFQTDQLYEQTNVTQVVQCIFALGIEAQSRPDYRGPADFWPKRHTENRRDFSDEQLRAGQSVIGLQMGSNKGATASGQNFGKPRSIVD
jgi:hypothetical protein